MALSFDEELAHFERELSGDLPSPPADTVTGNEVNTAAAEESAPKLQKRKTPPTNAKNKPAKQQKAPQNTGVYVTNLPLDVTLDEVVQEFTRWGGIISLNTDGVTPRVKMYTDDEGKFKGDALIVYHKPESVPLAIMMADNISFRAGEEKNGLMSVQAAERSAKKHQTKESAAGKMSRQDRKNAERVRAETNAKLAVWDSDEEEVLKKSFAPKKNKWAKCVVIYNAFRPIELEEDLDLYNVHKDEMDGVAEILEIKVTKVDIYDLEPRGIIVVRTTDFDDAKKLMNYVNNTKKLYQPYDDPFPKRRLWAEILEDRPKFRKSKEALISDDEDDMPLPQGKVAKDETKAVEDEVKAVKDEVNVTKDDVKVTKDDNDD